MRTGQREPELKARLISALRRRRAISSRTIIANEFQIRGSAVRADLALLGPDFVGVEIKSEFDTLKRLPNQLEGYRKYFDRILLVLAERHVASFRALGTDGFAVELWVETAQGAVLPVDESADRSRSQASPCFTALLTKRERLNLARAASSDTATELAARDAFTLSFRNRYGQTSANFWESVGRREVKSSDIPLLSRWHEQKLLLTDYASKRSALWSQWGDHAIEERA